MIYIDNAATTFPKPPVVHDAATTFIRTLGANPGRGSHRMAASASQVVESARLALARFIGAGGTPERVVFAHNCTDALNMAIKGAVRARQAHATTTPHVVTSVLEHNSVSRPLEQLAADGAITLTRVGSSTDGYLSVDDVVAALRPETCLVALTHASNVLGTVQPIAAIGAAVRERTDGSAWFLVDAAQTIGVEPIDVEAAHVDLLAFPGHKALFGYPGTGGLYVSPRVTLLPWREGGTGGDSKHPVQPDEYPHRLEGGTHNTVGIASLGAGLAFIGETTPAAIREHEAALAARFLDGLAQIPGVTVRGPRGTADRVATIAFDVGGFGSQDVAAILDSSFDIAVRAGLQCSPYCHQMLGTHPDGLVRASFGYFNTEADVDALLAALDQIASA
jgi:cysteine desulfurase/selenocysteine lyase